MKQHENDRYRALVESAPVCIHEIALDGSVTAMNKAGLSMIGLNEECQILGRNYLDLVGEDNRAEIATRLAKAVEGETSHFEFSINMDTKMYHFSSCFIPIQNDSGEVTKLMGVSQDITRRVEAVDHRARLEGELRHTQKLDLVGSLAGGLAHDLNNFLTPVTGYLQLALHDLPDDSEVASFLRHASNGADRAAALVKQMLLFSRKATPDFTVSSIDEIATEAISLFRSSMPSSIELHCEIQPCKNILADVNQIHQIILNLITNGIHAMGDAGVLTCSVTDRHFDEGDVSNGIAEEAGDYVQLSVSDTGPGISAELQERIFEPFFTTKEGSGTGLGLAVVQGIVESHGGAISVRCADGTTTFTVLLPAYLETADQAPPLAALATQEFRGNGQKILIVDDQVPVMEIVRSALEYWGYSVEAYRESPAAWTAFAADPDRYDVVITDQTMPVLSGVELIRRMRNIRSETPMMILTGYSVVAIGAELPDVIVLAKPVRIHELVATIHGLLKASQPKADEVPADRR